MEKLPDVTLIVLNWNGRSFLKACLSALSTQDYPQFKIILVDNASSDDSVEFVAANFPHIRIVQNHRNWGFARGNNIVLSDLQSEFAVLVNPDIIVQRGWLRELMLAMVADQKIAVAGCKLYFPGEQLIQHAGGSITQPRAMPHHRGVREKDHGQFDTLGDVDYVTGAVFAIRKSAMQAIGTFDEGFFMYYEESDYCARARAAGFRVVYVPKATAVHEESALAVRGSRAYLERFQTGRWRYLLKHFQPQEIIATTFPAEEEWLKSLLGDERLAVQRAYRTTLAGLTSIVAARRRDGGTKISTEQKSSIETGLRTLRRIAFDNPQNKRNLDELAARALLQEQPFSSATPLIGPLLAQLRSLWAAVAVRESVSGLIRQQSAFNSELAQLLREIENGLPLPPDAWQEKDESLGAIKQQQVDIDAQMARAYQLLASIRSRLERLEDKSAHKVEHDVKNLEG